MYVADPCFTANYSYYLMTTNSIDASSMIFTSFFDMLALMFTGRASDRLDQKREDEVLAREIGESAAEDGLSGF